MITNGAPALQRFKIKGSGLEHYFNAIIISGDLETRKPEPKIFNAILKKLSVKSREAVYIGNSLETDIGGANNAGIKSVWLNRDGQKNNTGTKPDFEICSLGELDKLIW